MKRFLPWLLIGALIIGIGVVLMSKYRSIETDDLNDTTQVDRSQFKKDPKLNWHGMHQANVGQASGK